MSSIRRLLIFAVVAGSPSLAIAQGPPPRIGPLVIDGRGTVPVFTKDQQLADSRGLLITELPGAGFGVEAGAHFYLLKWKAITFGLGAQVTVGRSHSTPADSSSLRSVTERFTSFTPQLSLNFGTGNGWSYISGGIGSGKLFLVPDGGVETPVDQTALRTVNYGGGARWFIKPRLAFTLDVRWHQLDPASPQPTGPGTPRMTFMIFGAGASVKPW